MPYRDTFTVTKLPDGQWTAKQHGMPVTFEGKTAEECLTKAGRAAAVAGGFYDKLMEPENG